MSQASTPLMFDFDRWCVGWPWSVWDYLCRHYGVIGRHTTPEKRSLALGIASAGGSSGQFAVLPVGQMLISTYGWQSALILFACGVGLIAPLAAALADGHKPSAGVGQSVKQALHEASRQKSFHFYSGAILCGVQRHSSCCIYLHFLVDAGFSANVGMTAVALIGLFNILGSFLFGWGGGRGSKNSCSFLSTPCARSDYAFYDNSAVHRSSLGICGRYRAALARYRAFDQWPHRANFRLALYVDADRCVVFLGHQLGSFLGAWLGGRIFDVTGSYSLAWLITIILSVLAAICSWPINENRLSGHWWWHETGDSLVLSGVGVAVGVVILALDFMAYQMPELLLDWANLRYCG